MLMLGGRAAVISAHLHRGRMRLVALARRDRIAHRDAVARGR